MVSSVAPKQQLSTATDIPNLSPEPRLRDETSTSVAFITVKLTSTRINHTEPL
eukprot:CAMPEP_0185754234 /NCGR_PEP_ID=MMETSP1174-20130828/12876_1 /TAXON_ID=35687 /ORGANISM="Dictyocha speculum, Strain CCMP1381" /LENGTH=52 /DNA_ID=CAMNT_0028432357 /DNA_START=50 /DNA_END=205 /DNA_ORIENTATION=+